MDPLIKTVDGGYAMIGSKKYYYGDYETKSIFYLLKLDENGDSLWAVEFDEETRSYGMGLAEDESGNLYIIGGVMVDGSWPDFEYAKVIKTDAFGNLVWEKEFNFSSSNSCGYGLLTLSDGNLLIYGDGSVYKLDADGNIIWEYISFALNLNSVAQYTDGSVLLGGNSVRKLDSDGNLIWKKLVPGSVIDILVSDVGNIAATIDNNGSELVAFDFDLNTIWSRGLSFGPNKLELIPGDGFIVAGGPWLQTIDIHGDCDGIFLQDPSGISPLNSFYEYEITWTGDKDTYISLEFSSNGGADWRDIISYYPSIGGHFNWTVPNDFSDDCFVRIVDYYDNDITDTNLLPFTITVESGNDVYDYISINEVKMWISNNGDGSHDPTTDGSGFFWPAGIDGTKTGIFEDGLLFGGKLNGEIRVGGNLHRQGLQAGKILEDGTPDNCNQAKYHIYKITKGWEMLSPGPLRDRYEHDYLNWPVEDGAPWVDNDFDGIFTPGIDVPEYYGDETLFYVANGADTSRSTFIYGSLPLPLEFQTLVWGFETEELKM